MLRSFSKTNKTVLSSFRAPSRSISTQGFYKNSEDLQKIKKQELPDEQVNEIIRKGEQEKQNETMNLLTTDKTENNAHVNKAQKKIKKMVPKDVEKFD